ncbi:hypothetical protein KUTeg_017761 [Tegillarca granosa]|uniref:Uncharacterized protein n=1 Tax=Tegillarca granosa TaxID=220873 RepID=A0ABQ9EFV5_TEGGR|nr:hypothetical protein KUTeg_017761 [Tegillarca granosa]
MFLRLSKWQIKLSLQCFLIVSTFSSVTSPDETVGEGRMYARPENVMCPHPDKDDLWQRPLGCYNDSDLVLDYCHQQERILPLYRVYNQYLHINIYNTYVDKKLTWRTDKILIEMKSVGLIDLTMSLAI